MGLWLQANAHPHFCDPNLCKVTILWWTYAFLCVFPTGALVLSKALRPAVYRLSCTKIILDLYAHEQEEFGLLGKIWKKEYTTWSCCLVMLMADTKKEDNKLKIVKKNDCEQIISFQSQDM